MLHRHLIVALTLATASLSFICQAALAVTPEAFANAFAQFQKAGQGDEHDIQSAVGLWKDLSAAEPTDPVLRVYAGSATAMQSGTTMLPWRKMSYAEDGLALIDKALAQLTPAHDRPAHRGVPASLETRFVAASTFLKLPDMFHRHERGEKLLADVLQSPLFETSPLGFKVVVWMRAGDEAAQAKRGSEAREYFAKVAASNQPQAAAAQVKLKGL